MMTFYGPILAQIRRLLARPTDELNRAQRALRWAVDLAWHCTHELHEDRAAQMAAALTYRTIFGLVPFFVLSLIVFNAFGGFKSVSNEIHSYIYDYLGLSSITLTEQVETVGATDDTTQTQLELQASVQKILDDLNKKVAAVSFASIGVVGLVILIWAALSLVVTVEHCFNRVYNCMTGRAWHLRIAIYWAVITLGPVLLMVSLYVTGRVIGHAEGVWMLDTVVGWLSHFTAIGASWLLLFLIYTLMPNTTVRLRPALIGSLVAAILWEFAKFGFKLYLTQAVGYSVLYGSLGLIPLFLFWVYLTWLIVLFGLELTYTLQAMHGRQFKSQAKLEERDMILDPRWVIPMMAIMGKAFGLGQPVTVARLAQRMALPIRVVGRLGEHLNKAGLLHRVEREQDGDPGYILALPPEQIRVKQLLELGQSLALNEQAMRRVPGRDMLAQLSAAEQKAAATATLASVLQRGGEA